MQRRRRRHLLREGRPRVHQLRPRAPARARPGAATRPWRSSAFSYENPFLYGAFVCARGALNRPKRRFSAPGRQPGEDPPYGTVWPAEVPDRCVIILTRAAHS
jgi:hypothetical protein